jgi:hypothetical protein
LFEAVKKPFHLLAQLVEVFIIAYLCCPVVLGGYDRHNVMRDEVLSDAVAVIALVHNRMCEWLLRRYLRKHGLKDRTLMPLAGCEDERDA